MNEPISRDEVYRTLRALVVRMDATAAADPKAETLDQAAARLGWAVAIDRILDAIDCVK